MKLEVTCAKFNGTGACASIEDDDGYSLTVAEGRNYTSKYACTLAAKRLRDAADRLDILANESEPFKSATHQRINAMRKAESV